MSAGEPPGTGACDVPQLEARLRAHLAEVRERLAKLSQPPEQSTGVQFGKRVGDGTAEAISRFHDVGVANDLLAIEERIERALEKLAEGTFGFCDECGAAIGPGRLRVAPESVLCIDCARGWRGPSA
jgi:DnaK suppressor protein